LSINPSSSRVWRAFPLRVEAYAPTFFVNYRVFFYNVDVEVYPHEKMVCYSG